VKKLKIVIAPDSFKESLTALEVANAIEEGFKRVLPNAIYVKVPVADGGEGTVQAMVDACGGDIIKLPVSGPLGDEVEAFYGLLGDGRTAVIEMAAASGLHLVPFAKRNPLLTSSFGTGTLILHALNKGVKKIILGLGGSATNDGGVGMMTALGARFLTKDGQAVRNGGQGLSGIAHIDTAHLDSRLVDVHFEVACDVDNPLCGRKGASAVFGPQKGATPGMAEQLDSNLGHYANQLKLLSGKDVRDIEGAGAAGGMGAALLAFLSTRFRPGIEIVMETVGLAEKVAGASLVITGEGRIDSQTLHGKAPVGVARIAKAAGCKVIAIAGCLSTDSQVVHQYGFDAVFSITPGPMDLQEALLTGAENLTSFSTNLAIALAMKLD
jgi:glycerate kinase